MQCAGTCCSRASTALARALHLAATRCTSTIGPRAWGVTRQAQTPVATLALMVRSIHPQRHLRTQAGQARSPADPHGPNLGGSRGANRIQRRQVLTQIMLLPKCRQRSFPLNIELVLHSGTAAAVESRVSLFFLSHFSLSLVCALVALSWAVCTK